MLGNINAQKATSSPRVNENFDGCGVDRAVQAHRVTLSKVWYRKKLDHVARGIKGVLLLGVTIMKFMGVILGGVNVQQYNHWVFAFMTRYMRLCAVKTLIFSDFILDLGRG